MQLAWTGALTLTFCLLAPAARADTADACATEAERANDARDAGRVKEALAGYLGCARAECPKVVRNDCRAALARVRERAPRIVLRVRDQETDRADAEVTIDGVALTAEERTQGVIVDAGSHMLKATLPDGRSVLRTVVVTVSDRTRNVDLALAAPPPEKTPPTPPPAPTAEGLPTALPGGTSGTERRTAALVVGGVGLALAATAGVLGTWTYLDYRDLEERCGAGCTDREIDGPRTRGLAADITLGVSVVTLVVATVLYLTAPTPASRRARLP